MKRSPARGGRAIRRVQATYLGCGTFAGFRMETAELTYSIGQASRGTKAVTEVLIYTFEPPTLPMFG